MILSLFSRRSRANEAVTSAVYVRIVAAARQTRLYEEFGVPDTPIGRFEMLSLHVYLFLHRVRGMGGAVSHLAQEVTDMFFRDLDHSLREIGIGDMGVPKRVKKFGRMFYGRVAAYDAAVDSGDCETLALALSRNVRPGEAQWSGAAPLADYVMGAVAGLDRQDPEAFLGGRIEFPAAAAHHASALHEGDA